ncbi:unnamed protein product [Arabis nemorensis]|uniref:Uncharacterized protein n=1 Tax=Arabis nemorensis TaxID=586526 RepID=A0A565BES7_9BRAS|nr:unnamed protein product [Arabis nemorensis]
MEGRNNVEIKLEETIARQEENLEKVLLECYEDEQDKSRLQARPWSKCTKRKYVRAIEREKLEKVKCELETFKIRHELVEEHVHADKRDVNAMREERDNALKLVHEITTKHDNMCLNAERFESKYKRELIFTTAFMKEKQVMKTKHENMCLKVKEFESEYKSELNLTKALMKEKQEITTKHENMCLKAKKFKSKYKRELNLKEDLMKEKEELEISYNIKDADADAMRKERDNAIEVVNEITTRLEQLVASFICPISQASPYNLDIFTRRLHAQHSISYTSNIHV